MMSRLFSLVGPNIERGVTVKAAFVIPGVAATLGVTSEIDVMG
jgi:hypothetical protein